MSARIGSFLLQVYGRWSPVRKGKRAVLHLIASLADDYLSKRGLVKVRRAGFEWSLDLREYIDQWIYYTGWFERPSVKAALRCLRAGDAVLDVGAHIGAFALHAGRAVGARGKVLAFQPHLAVVDRLQGHIALNGLTNIYTYDVALGEKCGAAKLWTAGPGKAGDSTIIEVTTIDHLVRDLGLVPVDFIKIDAGGCRSRSVTGSQRDARGMPSQPFGGVQPGDVVGFGLEPRGVLEADKRPRIRHH